MSTLIKIAWRNVRRNKRRTFLSALIIAVGLAIFIYMDSMMAGMDRSNIDNLIELSTSSIRITTREYAEDIESLPLKYGLNNVQELTEFILHQEHVSGASSRTKFLGQLSNWEETMPVIGQVVDAKTDASVFDLMTYLEGNFFSEEGENEIILGKGLAGEMGVQQGDYITLYALTKYESRNADEFHIVGLLNTSDPNINLNTIMITYETADGFLDLEGLVTELYVSMERRVNYNLFVKDVKQLQSKLQSRFPEFQVDSYLKIASGFLKLTEQKKAFGMIFMLIILAIAAVGIFNSVLMSVYERIREIGVLRAQGMKRGEIITLFLWEGGFIGIIGSILGLIIGCGVNIYFVLVGFPLDQFKALETSGLPFLGRMYGEWNIGAIVFVFLFGIFIAIAASYLPSRMASKMEVTKAIRYV